MMPILNPALPRVPMPWYGVRREGTTAKVALKGAIGEYGPPVSELIKQIGDAQSIKLAICDVYGGEAGAMWALLDAIGGRIETATIFGHGVQSAGAFIAISAKNLKMVRSAKMMIHAGKYFVCGGSDAYLLEQMEKIRQLNQRISKLISSRTGRDAAEYMDGKDHWFSAPEAKAANLIDEIV